MNESTFIKNKLLEATIRNLLTKENENGKILFETPNSVIGTCDCYFSTKQLVDGLNQPFSLKNGLCYSINYGGSDVLFRLILNGKYLEDDALFTLLVDKYDRNITEDKCCLFEHKICSSSESEETLTKLISTFLNKDLVSIEDNLLSYLSEYVVSLKELHEGEPITVELTKYERNKEARLLCIKHYGAKCAICGFDFGKVYGDDFDGMIEVHHKKPLYEIKEDYIVDPINDLIPVCPNCHSAIHSKKDGFYTVEELKKLLGNK